MHIAIRQGVDKINSLQADSLLSEEIDIELNKNMRRFINLKYGKNNIHRKGFEESQKRIDDLSTLVEEYRNFTKFGDRERLAYYSTSTTTQYLFREIFELPYNYMHHIESSCNTLRSNAGDNVSYRLEYYNDVDYEANEEFEANSKYIIIPWSTLYDSSTQIVAGKIELQAGLELATQDSSLGLATSWGAGGPGLEELIWEAEDTSMLLQKTDQGGLINIDNTYKEYIIHHILSNHNQDFIVRWERSNELFFKDSFIVILKPNSNVYNWARTQGEAAEVVNTLENAGAAAGFNADGEYVTTSPTYTDIESFTTKLKICGIEIENDDGSSSYETVYPNFTLEEIDTVKIVGYKRKFTNPSNTANRSNIEDTDSTYWTVIGKIGKNFEGLNLPITYIQHDDLHGLLKDPFNRPSKTSLFGIFTHKSIELYTMSNSSGSSVHIPDSVKIKYLRTPLPMSLNNNINCELPQHTHEEIVAMTVSSILEGFSDPRYRTQVAELNKQE